MSAVERAARGSGMLMGGVFLVAGAIKVWDPVLFFWESLSYIDMLALGPEVRLLAARVTPLLGPLECGLGFALMVHWRPNLVFPFSTVLLILFIGVTFSAWYQGYTGSCGCFGVLLERRPGEAAVEDMVMLGFLSFAWWGTRSVAGPTWISGRYVVLWGTVLATVVWGIQYLPEFTHLTDKSDLQVGTQLESLTLKGMDNDLSQGDYLVEIFSPTCSRCQRAVPKLNQLMSLPNMPPVVALTRSEKDAKTMVAFIEPLQPHYMIATISMRDLWRLAGGYEYPRLFYMRDGEIRAIWEYNEFPDEAELKRLVRRSL
jgi:hypothetical protein